MMKSFSIAKSRRLRGTPYTSRIEKQGVTAYTIYNHMLLPAAFGSIEDSYHHLKQYVQIWDVAAERQVEISGKDSAKLVQLMTCRDLSKSKDGRCYYCPIIDDNAGLINDPVVLRLNENKWWVSLADSDVILFAKGLAIGNKFDVKIFEPDVDIMAIQGPKSFELMEKVFGDKIVNLKFFGFDYFEFGGDKHLIARSGWSKQGGYEIYVEHNVSGLKLYDHLFEIEKGFMTTIHAFTSDQRILDNSHKDPRRARSASQSIVPTSTGASKAIGEIIPSLKGKLEGVAMRVPTPNVSLVELVFCTKKNINKENINQSFELASKNNLKNVLEITHEKLVSIDFNHNPASAIVDGSLTNVVGDNMGKISAWYDNEWGFSNRMCDIAEFIHQNS